MFHVFDGVRPLLSVEPSSSNCCVLVGSAPIKEGNSLGPTTLEIENPGMFLAFRMGHRIRIYRMLSTLGSTRETVFFSPPVPVQESDDVNQEP